MLRLPQPVALAALAAGRCPASRAAPAAFHSTASSSSALEWLKKFVNYEQRGVLQAAGTDSDAGFDLVRTKLACAACCRCIGAAAVALLPAHAAACTGSHPLLLGPPV